MFGIVKNAWIDNLRSRKRERAVVRGDDGIEDVPDAAHTAAEDRLSIALRCSGCRRSNGSRCRWC